MQKKASKWSIFRKVSCPAPIAVRGEKWGLSSTEEVKTDEGDEPNPHIVINLFTDPLRYFDLHLTVCSKQMAGIRP